MYSIIIRIIDIMYLKAASECNARRPSNQRRSSRLFYTSSPPHAIIWHQISIPVKDPECKLVLAVCSWKAVGIHVDISPLTLPSPSYVTSAEWSESGLGVLVLDAALALVVDEGAASRTSASLATEESRTASLCTADVVVASATGSTSQEQEDCREEHGGPSAPCKAECVPADAGCKASVTEAVAGFDEDGTAGC